MSSAIRAAAVAAALACLAPLAHSQGGNPNMENDLVLHNGVDVLYGYSDPSEGGVSGLCTPDIANGDFYWRVFPKEVLFRPNGVMEISGMDFFVFDTDWSTSPDIYDMVISKGIASVGFPGNIEPDFNDPNAVCIGIGNSGLPDPCIANPQLCVGGCAPAGFVNGYELDIQIGTGAGDGILIDANGANDYVLTNFLPGGMSFTGGSCGNGDYAMQDAHSSGGFGGQGETIFDFLGGGYSAYGGFQIGGAAPAIGPEPVDEVTCHTLAFVEPVIEGSTLADLDPVNNPHGLGLASLHTELASGTNGIGVHMKAYDQIGEFGFAFGAFLPPFPAPGIPLPGSDISFLVNITDPLVNDTSAIWNGTIVVENLGGPPFDNGVLDMTLVPITGPLIPALVGQTMHIQGFTLNFSTLDFDDTGLITHTYH